MMPSFSSVSLPGVPVFDTAHSVRWGSSGFLRCLMEPPGIGGSGVPGSPSMCVGGDTGSLKPTGRLDGLISRRPGSCPAGSQTLCPSRLLGSEGKQEENDVVEKLNLFLDLLQSYKDLCERHEKGVLHKHQRALHKYSLMKRQMMSAAVQNREPESVEQLESRIVEQENAIQTMELRNYFSLYCLHQETQLIHVYLPLTSHILRAFVNSQIQGHKEVSPPLLRTLSWLRPSFFPQRPSLKPGSTVAGCSREVLQWSWVHMEHGAHPDLLVSFVAKVRIMRVSL
ncbi:uncharacterized protein LOC116547874 [Sapajus apella]|uniref:Uncharacterized protein LOC116547874 n=1 Tax=Sapajus apella TaxID=9515 RepID=A0A6J3HHH8_SAPAP|nr:uncharacterized protein LOC116547874 [Sapajus apella]